MSNNGYFKTFTLSFALLFLFTTSFAQLASINANNKRKSLLVCSDQKLTLIFPSNVSDAVLGNNKINVIKNNNKCFVNAVDSKIFQPTSLFITLNSGEYYDFIIKCKPKLDTAVYLFKKTVADGFDKFL